jgi:hypothetical protein
LDGITKDHERLVRYFPLTGRGILISDSFYISFSVIVEVVSAVIGLMVIYFFILRLPKVAVPDHSFFKKMVFWIVCFLTTVLVIYLRLSVGAIAHKYDLLITGISAFMIGLVVSSLWTMLGPRSASGGLE